MEICEPYSGYCATPPPTIELYPIPKAGDMPSGPVDAELPLTGIMVGDIVSVAVLLLVLGALLVFVAIKYFK